MTVFFNDGTIIVGRTSAVKQAIKLHQEYDRFLKYKFSSPFSQYEECLHDARTGKSFEWLCKWFTEDVARKATAQARREGLR